MKKIILIIVSLFLFSCTNDDDDVTTIENCNCREVRLKYYATPSGVVSNWVPYGVADIPRPDLSCEMNGVKFFENNQSNQDNVLIYKGVYVCD